MDKEKTIKYTKVSTVVLLIFLASGYYLYDHTVEFRVANNAVEFGVAIPGSDILTKLLEWVTDYVVRLGVAKPTLILTISTNLTEDDTPLVNNVTFEQSGVPFFYKRVDSIPKFPEIDVNARINKLDSAPASYWASTTYTGEGTYTLTLFFKDGNEPKEGDILILPIRITGPTGVIVYKTTAFWLWE
ncbi:hypothetical protein ANME2D_02829 [Candidatus Methanoperedens nitroreducens]|uniref:Uncharacterized protein n=1 Tax=Candidatus Methanoperedens nitratireducens TaxID=1392998 RepID=A0A062V4R5_9EURY|nr:hypothetical protein [Candidatus Methanoperedens nitroreducens]KCZ70804.1 hypothetical protein ANME2D_02829 [Candidatus Methanoperedens nitroreducens]MDJ1420658.1 hypothetical protein [Candidatus Methanoperedens sp.]